MSLEMVLIPLAVAIYVTSAELLNGVKEKCINCSNNQIEEIETRFVNADLLISTLRNHGVELTVHNANLVEAKFQSGKIVYHRTSAMENYKMQILNVGDVDELICSLDLLENEYDTNVQSYTYHQVVNNLPDGMNIETEEVLEDDSILITISVE